MHKMQKRYIMDERYEIVDTQPNPYTNELDIILDRIIDALDAGKITREEAATLLKAALSKSFHESTKRDALFVKPKSVNQYAGFTVRWTNAGA